MIPIIFRHLMTLQSLTFLYVTVTHHNNGVLEEFVMGIIANNHNIIFAHDEARCFLTNYRPHTIRAHAYLGRWAHAPRAQVVYA